MSNEDDRKNAKKVEDVLAWEKANVHRERKTLGKHLQEQRRLLAPEEAEVEADGPAALCLSGGGIRSASVSLGFLQACDRLAILKKFDYLFTVSGGGYIGGWLTALIHRLGQHTNLDLPVGIDEDQGAINPTNPGAAAVANLRRYSNYLTPRLGFFSGDSLALVAVYMRNLFLNGLILLSLVGAVTVLPKIIYRLFASEYQWLKWLWASPFMPIGSAILAALSGAYSVYAASGSKRSETWLGWLTKITGWLPWGSHARAALAKHKTKPGADSSQVKPIEDSLSTDNYVVWKLTPLLLSLLILSVFAYRTVKDNRAVFLLEWLGGIGLVVGGVCALVLFLWGLMRRVPEDSSKKENEGQWRTLARRSTPRSDQEIQFSKTICNVIQIIGAYAIGSIAFLQISRFPADPRLFLICIPPALLTIYLIGVALFAGFVNPILSDDDREWWSRSSGYLLFTLVLWLIVFGVSLCADIFPGLLVWFWHGFDKHSLMPKMSGITWASATAALSGLLAVLTRDSNVVSPGANKGIIKMIGSVVLVAACPVFIFALLFSLSIGEAAIGKASGHPGLCYLGLLIVLVLVATTLSCVVNVNRFSLHNTYRNRLIRTFLGASHAKRKPNSFTGFCEKDNLFLKDIRSNQRPYHVICGTVNLYAGAELAWQERRATLFTFSRDHCGCDFLDYRPTEKFGGPDGISLGTAIAISGAAANPNMGFYTAPDRAFVMTLLNVRLGWWLGNPKFQKGEPWRREGPFPALWPLIAEMLLLTRESSNFINVSDGGHFDDTGVYEAVRRRCSTIFLVDVNTTHENVARMIRKVRIDFGVDITLKRDFSGSGIPGQLYLIHYPKSERNQAASGVLIRVYPALEPFRSELPADVLNFSNGDPSFPSDQIANQWYGEAQFESYRKLGREIGMRLFAHKEVGPIVNAL
jgi:hypothetical protein